MEEDTIVQDVNYASHVENNCEEEDPSSKDVFPFLKLPRELRDLIYTYTFTIPDPRSIRALRIERRNLKYFSPTAAAILLILHHEYFLLNRQVAREALEVLLKGHTVFLSCGPYVLKAILSKIEEHRIGSGGGVGKRWLRWMKSIELDWVTFPNLTHYPPDREGGRDEWYWEQHEEEGESGYGGDWSVGGQGGAYDSSGHGGGYVDDEIEVDVDYIRGVPYNGHYDEYDHAGAHYDDNFYDPDDSSLYPTFRPPAARNPPPGPPPNTTSTTNTNGNAPASDPFGFTTHYPFSDPSLPPDHQSETHALSSHEDIATKLSQLVSMEVTPLFTYLSSPTFSLSSITIPLYFISRESFHHRNLTRPGYALPLKIRYWVQVCVHALMMLQPLSLSANEKGRGEGESGDQPTLKQVRIRYLPWDIWASMDPADDLYRVSEKGVWFDEKGAEATEREGEGEAFRAVWASLREKGYTGRMGLDAKVTYVKWDGNVDSWSVGDGLEVVFSRNETGGGNT